MTYVCKIFADKFRDTSSSKPKCRDRALGEAAREVGMLVPIDC
jgi:hypothetical protein